MNYQKIYDDICKRGQIRPLPKDVYTEKHHIIPKCLGGDNEKSNITKLTAREHFLVHYILAEKLYPTDAKLWYSFVRMCNSKNAFQKRVLPNGRLYEYARIRLSDLYRSGQCPATGTKRTEEHKQIVRNANLGKTISKEHKEVLSNLYTGKTYEERFGECRSKEIKSKLRLSANSTGVHNPMYGKSMSSFAKVKMKETWTLRGTWPTGSKNGNARKVCHVGTGMIFNTRKEAAAHFNISLSKFYKLLKSNCFVNI